MTVLVLFDSDRKRAEFADVEAAIRHIRGNWEEKFTAYGLEDMYEQLRKIIVDAEYKQCHVSLDVIREWKDDADTWHDIADFNDMRDEILERLAKSRRRLQYGGDVPPGEGGKLTPRGGS